MKKLNIILTFHANQSHSNNFISADFYSYNKLLKTLIDSEVKHVLHFSSTLLQVLNELIPERIEQLRRLISLGNTEFLGSTFAQNIPYASSENDNHHQLRLGRQTVSSILGINPVGFWNPERCWKNSQAQMLVEHGYSYTLLEDAILPRNTLNAGALPLIMIVKKNNFVVFPESIYHHQLFNTTIETGDCCNLFDYYRSLVASAGEGENCVVCYAQDAEAYGLWQVANGSNGDAVFSALSNTLDSIKREPWLRLTTFADYLAEFPVLNYCESIPDGQASWMVNSSRELGYMDWFDYQSNNSEVCYYRKLYEKIETRINETEERIKVHAKFAELRLIELARIIYAARQFEFGCAPGNQGSKETTYDLNVHGMAQWECAREALFSVWAAGLPQNIWPDPPPCFWDFDEDGVEELLIVEGDLAYVLSPIGGKLLFWFDLSTGAELIGNVVFDYWARKWNNNSEYVGPFFWWKNEHIRFRGRGFEDFLDVDCVSVGTKAIVEFDVNPNFHVYAPNLASTIFTAKLIERGVEFECQFNGINFSKIYKFDKNECNIEYHFKNNINEPRNLDFNTFIGLSPDNLSLLNLSSKVIETSLFENGYKIHNSHAELGVSVNFIPDRDLSVKNIAHKQVFGKLLQFAIGFEISPMQDRILRFRLSVQRPNPVPLTE